MAEDPRKLRIVFVEPTAAGPDWSRPRPRGRGTDVQPPAQIIDIFALSVVGMLERVIVEKQGGRLDVPMDDLIDYCAAFAAASLRAVYSGQIAERTKD
ncbi:hypothetical protein ACQP2U_16470 [Nocardia sp. CA-084685]|uniref:hypothetical protein n=1 Tax=Nocardia sp. CA-084685 TaxID=3239970 RepID=UPI003D9728B9